MELSLRSLSLSLVLGLLALAACHSTPRPKTAAPASSPFGERRFLLQSSEGAAGLAGVTVHLGFQKSSLSFSADCNQMGGDFVIEGERLVVAGVFSTEMGCDAARHAQDDWLQAFFTSRPSFELAGNTLTLASERARLVFLDREVADPDRPLVGTVWEVNTYIDGGTAMGLMGIEGPRIIFVADGTWQARSICLDASGRYTVTGERIALSGTQATEGNCADNDKTAAEHVRSVMVDGELRYTIDAFSLTLDGSGPRGLGANALNPK